jgi:hypothetical protein
MERLVMGIASRGGPSTNKSTGNNLTPERRDRLPPLPFAASSDTGKDQTSATDPAARAGPQRIAGSSHQTVAGDFSSAKSAPWKTIRMIDANIGFVLRSAIDQGNWRS